MTPGPKALEAILKRCGIRLEGPQIGTLWRYHEMLREANVELNLTRIHNFENMVLKHYVDSLLVLRFIDLPSPLIDMGSGPGLPGIPLKIARPAVRMILAEPRGARAAFLREVCDQLDLKGIEVYRPQVRPGLSRPGRGCDQPGGGVDPGDAGPGRVVPLSGRPDDLHEGTRVRRRDRRGQGVARGLFRLVAEHAYAIPGTTHQRRLLVYERQEGEAAAAIASDEKPNAPSPSAARSARSPVRPIPRSSGVATYLLAPGIRKHGEAILAGSRIRDEVLARFPDHVLGWLTDAQGPASAGRIDRVAPAERSALQGARRRRDSRPALAGERAGDRCLVGR